MIDLQIYNKGELKGTQYIELASAPKGGKAGIWNDNSLYMSDTPFSFLFSPAFYNASEKYNLFGFAELDLSEQEKLIQNLQENAKMIENIETYDDLIKYSNRPNTEYNFKDILFSEESKIEEMTENMKAINQRVLDFVTLSLNKRNILAVLGL